MFWCVEVATGAEAGAIVEAGAVAGAAAAGAGLVLADCCSPWAEAFDDAGAV